MPDSKFAFQKEILKGIGSILLNEHILSHCNYKEDSGIVLFQIKGGVQRDGSP